MVEEKEPLLKWPGGKRRLVDDISDFVPGKYRRYYEPFVGGGAMFFALNPSRATLSDTNDQLINCYRAVRDEPDKLISALASLRNSEKDYYRIRTSRPTCDIDQAATVVQWYPSSKSSR